MLERTRLSFSQGRWKICVTSPCGHAFVCVGLSEEMSRRAARARRAVLRAGPRAAAAGRTSTADSIATAKNTKKKKSPQRNTHAGTCLFFHLLSGAHAGTRMSEVEGRAVVITPCEVYFKNLLTAESPSAQLPSRWRNKFYLLLRAQCCVLIVAAWRRSNEVERAGQR